MIESIFIFCLGACVSLLGMIIYSIKRQILMLSLLTKIYTRRKSKGNIMINSEKYEGESHNHYVFERMCPKCSSIVCGREPSDLRECRKGEHF